jgi:arsenate reductase
VKRFLFVCVANAGRSVMAETFCNLLSEGRAEAKSAGTKPADRPHAEVVEAMREIGIDVSSHHGRLIDDELVRWADRVFTMGCGVDEAACPAILYANVEDWELDDPKGRSLKDVRKTRDEIRARVEGLLAGAETPAPQDH